MLRSDSIVFYFPDQHRVLPSQVVGTISYVPILDLLNLTGKVSSVQEKRKNLRIVFGGKQLELRLDKNSVKLEKTNLTLSGPVRVLNGQWMVPADFISVVLPRLISQRIQYTASARRVFIGDVKIISYSLRSDSIPNGARLTIQFTGQVTVRSVSRNGKWILYLGGGLVQPPVQEYHLDSPFVSDVRFDDQDGMPKLVITPRTEGLNFYVKSVPGTKSTVAEIVKPPLTLEGQIPSQLPSPPPSGVRPPSPVPSAATAQVEPSLPVVVLDPGHGGQDPGARGGNGLLEKDLVAQVSEQVRQALVATQKFRVVVTRSGDTDPTFDERTLAANTVHPIAFISLHAGSFGEAIPRAAVYSYQPPLLDKVSAHESAPERSRAQRIFVPWDEIQRPHLKRSRQLAQDLAEEFGKIPGLSVQQAASAPVRILRSIDAPAVAVEIGSLAPGIDAQPLINLNLQQQIAKAVAGVVQALQGGHS
jgi:N-acetylmuramoyl-L-alanine amidase